MRILPGPTRSNQVLAWSPDGQFVAAGGSGDGIMVWDVLAGTAGRRVLASAHGGKLLQFCSRTGWLYVAFQSGGFWHWNPGTDEEQKHGSSAGYTAFHSLAVANDGRTIAVNRFRNRVNAVIGYGVTESGKLSEMWSRTDDRWVNTFAFRPDTGELFGLGRHVDGLLRFEWMQSETGVIVGSFLIPAECGRVKKWALAPDGERVAWLSENGLFLQRFEESALMSLPSSDDEFHRSLAWSPDSRILAYTFGTAVRLLDARTLSEIHAFDWNIGNIRAVAFSPDGLQCAVSGERGRGWVTVFDLE